MFQTPTRDEQITDFVGKMLFGDGDNDREMMAFSGRSVAVGNAIDALKESATFVTRNSWDDGVAYALEHYLNI